MDTNKKAKIMEQGPRCIVITANLGTLFEQYETLQDVWIDAFIDKIIESNASFVALHIQEAGGKNYKEDMFLVKGFASKIIADKRIANDFTRSFTVIDTDVESSAFTALGNVYLVHKDLEAQIWDFNASQFLDITMHSYHDHESEIVEKTHCARRERFPQEYYPQTKWSRKGYCQTRWKFAGKYISDFVNVHLFHDACNVTANTAEPSVYASNRRHALEFVVDHIASSQDSAIPTFFFGDFNFRLGMKQVLDHFTTEGYEVVEEVTEKGKQKVVVKAKEGDDVVLAVSEKKFLPKDPLVFLENKGKLFRPFDVETADLPKGLLEFPVEFEPSYPYSEEIDVPIGFLNKRCPGWCDRILLNDSAMSNIVTEENPYDLFGRGICTGDHKPIQLTFNFKSQ